MSFTQYLAYGLRIDSSIPLIGALPAGPVAGFGTDLKVEYHRDWPDVAPERVDGPYQWAGNTLFFNQAGCARYHITANRIGVTPCAGASKLEVAQMLVATALPAALWRRGLLVLHAAGVELSGQQRAIALAGPSGIGKSTLLHQLFCAGGRIVGDDTCTLSLCDDDIISRGLPARLALRVAGGGGQSIPPGSV